MSLPIVLRPEAAQDAEEARDTGKRHGCAEGSCVFGRMLAEVSHDPNR